MKYEGPRHFDAHAYRTEDYEGVKEFARGCMRTYLVFKEKSRRWNADKEIQALLKETSVSADGTPKLGRYSRKQADALLAQDRKSTRLNSSHRTISYAVFCL